MRYLKGDKVKDFCAGFSTLSEVVLRLQSEVHEHQTFQYRLEL